MKYPITMLAALIVFSASGQSKTLYVPDDHQTIQTGLLASADGDTIVVRAGIYRETVDFLGRAVTLKSERGHEFTVIDGSQSGSVVTFDSNESKDSILQGFTLTNGTGRMMNGHTYGGGVFCYGASPILCQNLISGNTANFAGGVYLGYSEPLVPVLTGNLITGNIADYDAGGVYCLYSSPYIGDNTIEMNRGLCSGARGGGIWCGHCAPRIVNNVIRQNSAITGGGIHCWFGSSPVIINNRILENTAVSGGGIYCAASASSRMIKNIIHENIAELGGGIFCGGMAMPKRTITNNTLYANSASKKGGGLYTVNGASPRAANTIFWNNESPEGAEIAVGNIMFPSTMHISFCDVKGGYPSIYIETHCFICWGSGMMNSNPEFMDPQAGDFHLSAVSRCINTGWNGAPDLPDSDFEGDPRIAFKTVDMGADEFHPHLYVKGNAASDREIEMVVIGPPGKDTLLCVGREALDRPVKTAFGEWHLHPPLFVFVLGPVPRHGDIMITAGVPKNLYAPLAIPMQALLRDSLTNLCVAIIE